MDLDDDVIDPSIMEIMNEETQPVVKEMSENSTEVFQPSKNSNVTPRVYMSFFIIQL